MEDVRRRIWALAEGTLPDHAGWVALIQGRKREDPALFEICPRAGAGAVRPAGVSQDHRVYELLQKRLLLLRHPPLEQELSRYRLTEDEIF